MCCLLHFFLNGNSHQRISVACMMELLLKSFVVHHSPMFKAWTVPKRPVEVSCDITQHLVAYRTALETRTNTCSSGLRTHTGQHSQLPCMRTQILLDWLYVVYRNRTETDDVTAHLPCTVTALRRLLTLIRPLKSRNCATIQLSNSIILITLVQNVRIW